MKTGNYRSRVLALCVIGVCVVCFGCTNSSTKDQRGLGNKQAELKALLKKIDRKLVAQWVLYFRSMTITPV